MLPRLKYPRTKSTIKTTTTIPTIPSTDIRLL
jgi:hypothetical protein